MTEANDSKTVLIIDDDASTRLMSKATLERSGFTVAEADSAEDAIERFDDIKPDAVLLDVSLPGIDGFRACEIIRGMPQGQFTPIMMLTGLQDVHSIDKAYEVGATDFVTKPMNWSILGHRIQYIIRANRAIVDLGRSQHRLQNAKKVAQIADWECDAKTLEAYWSPELYSLLGLSNQEVVKTHDRMLEFVHPDDLEMVTLALRNLIQEHRPYDIEYRLKHSTQGVIHVHERAEIIFDNFNEPSLYAGTIQDISKRKAVEEEVRHLAYYDALTGLANRTLFSQHLSTAIRRARRNNEKLAILFIDLDKFKSINDTLGHNAGDSFLQEVSRRLQHCLRDCDIVSRGQKESSRPVARFGGDEFTVLLTNKVSLPGTTAVAKRILEALSTPLLIEGQEIPVSASIGISIYPEDGTEGNQLIKNADAAMYEAKENGRNDFRFFDKSMNELMTQNVKIETDLQEAIDKCQLRVHYQPKIDIRTNKVVGTEALARWQHPLLGFVAPDEFIPLAEESDMMREIGVWIIQEACLQTRKWHNMGYDNLRVSINLTNKQFFDPLLVPSIRTALINTQLDAKFVILELTEAILMQDTSHTLSILKQLKAIGLSLSLDDFGTGFSSLRKLSEFPLDEIKIDRSFIHNLADSHNDRVIANMMINFAHGLNLAVVAVGVETPHQYSYLKSKHCELMQGNYFAEATNPDEISKFLNDNNGQANG